jgi:sigma-B regulation protein RsbU (phosphoserine phosphatase)
MAWLVALDGGFSGKRFVLETTFLVGRGPFNHLVLDDSTISRQHAKVAPEGGAHVAYDLGSANGTFVNNQPIKRQLLNPGDEVRFGPFRFRFEVAFNEDLALRGRGKIEEVTRLGFEVPSRILGEADAQTNHTLIATGGLAELEESERRLRTLFSFVHAIAATLDADALLNLIIANLFDAFPRARVAAVYTLDEPTGAMEPLRAELRGGDVMPSSPLPAELYTELVVRGKALLSVPFSLDMAEEALDSGPRSKRADPMVMHAPMVYRGKVLGVLNVRGEPGETFSQGDLDLLAALASHTGIALQNARLHQQSLVQQRLQRDLTVAQQIQKSFLPLSLPRPPGISFNADYMPALAIGGDFYDVFWLTHDRIGCTIGDVSGKGVSAALVMARVSSDLRTALVTEPTPALAMAQANRELCARGQHDIFVTAVALVLEVSTRKVTLANAGHMPPYVRQREEGRLLRIDAGASSPLGLFADLPFVETTIQLQSGDALVLTTDGVHEATNTRDEQLGFEGVERALSGGSSEAGALAARLLAAVKAHASGCDQYDDLTLLVCGVE